MQNPNSPTLREWLAAEPFTLTMSSGFFSFYAHAGVLSVLDQENLLPNQVSGSSAWALVVSLWASGCSMDELTERLFALRKHDFWDPGFGAGLLKGHLFQAILRDVAKVERLEDCRVPVRLSTFDVFSRSTRVFSAGDFDKIVYAACAVPFLFRPVWIDRRPYLDGGLSDRPGLAGIKTGTRTLYHHIQSRSPWRKKNSSALKIPARNSMQAITIKGLPSVGPNKLDQGPVAFEAGRGAALRALDLRVGSGPLEIDAGSLHQQSTKRTLDRASL